MKAARIGARFSAKLVPTVATFEGVTAEFSDKLPPLAIVPAPSDSPFYLP